MEAKKKRKNSVKTSTNKQSDTHPRKKSKIKTETRQSQNKKNDSIKVLIIAAATLILIGIFWLGPNLINKGEDTENYDDLNLPSYAYTNATTLKAYGYAIQNPEVIEKIPC